MIFEEQSEIRKILAGTKLPKFAMVRQIFPDDAIPDVAAYLKKNWRTRRFPAALSPA